MKTSLKKEFVTKTQGTFPAGTSFDVVMSDSDLVAIVTPAGGSPFKVRAISLGKYFKKFIKVNVAKMYGDEDSHMFDSAVCDSLTGAQVEPDGHDEYGFPSVLLAEGYV